MFSRMTAGGEEPRSSVHQHSSSPYMMPLYGVSYVWQAMLAKKLARICDERGRTIVTIQCCLFDGLTSCLQGGLVSPSSVCRDRKLFTTTSTGFCFSFCSNPMTCPTNPPGFGTGHSRCRQPLSSAVSAASSTASASFLFRRRLFFPSGVSTLSANCRLSTGHGSICGRPTTRNETASVVVNSVLVVRDLGWR